MGLIEVHPIENLSPLHYTHAAWMRATYCAVTPHFGSGAGRRNRTLDLMLTRQLLYRLSYTSETDVG